MAEVLKVLAQNSPAATTATDLYTVPGATSTTCSSLMVCNQNASAVHVRVSIAVAGAAVNIKQYLYYDVSIVKNSSITLVIGITLAATDVVRVYSDTTLVSFNLFGVEVS